MPIKIPNQLPATQVLESENIFVMTESRAMTQDIRPLQVLLLNLMPDGRSIAALGIQLIIDYFRAHYM